jgi:hypothetical protein
MIKYLTLFTLFITPLFSDELLTIKGINVDMSRSEIEKILIEKNYTCNNSDIKSTMCNIGKGTGKPNVVLLHDNQKHNHTVNIDNHKFPVQGTTIYAYCGFINSCYKSSETLKNSLVEKFKNLRCVEVDLKKHSSLQSF